MPLDSIRALTSSIKSLLKDMELPKELKSNFLEGISYLLEILNCLMDKQNKDAYAFLFRDCMEKRSDVNQYLILHLLIYIQKCILPWLHSHQDQ